MKKLGMRTIKTGIAVFICLALSHLFKMKFPFYAAIAAVICMQSTVYDSFNAGINRMIGTFVGALLGFGFSLMAQNNALLAGIGIIILIYICNNIKCNKSIPIACIVFLAIATDISKGPPFQYSYNRLLDTFLGIAVAVIVNYALLPPEFSEEINELCNELIDRVFIMAGTKIYHKDDISIEELNSDILKLENLLKIYKKEIKRRSGPKLNVEVISESVNDIRTVYTHLSVLETFDDSCTLNENNYVRVKNMFNPEMESLEYSDEDLNKIYNYHVDKIITTLENFQFD